MKVLLTGATSFSGFWFAERLAAAGAEVVAPLRGTVDSYSGVRGVRARRLAAITEIVPSCSFGDGSFLELVRSLNFDALCHHAARVGDYRSPDFDLSGAVAENTLNLRTILQVMSERGMSAVIATGSVFEQDEGAGNHPHRAFSPYGVSKGLTWQVIRYWCEVLGIPLGKFLIPNPFGPLEEARFVAYLVKTWRAGDVAGVKTPRYVRDNIHVGLLARAYAGYVASVVATKSGGRFGPSGYVETQGEFTHRVARELRPRLGLECRVEFGVQTDFSEPLIRVNTDLVDYAQYGFSESEAWDALVAHYQES
jgi:nucleoside-diphosphate-sugar epimerase